jgi:hypothetical protein
MPILIKKPTGGKLIKGRDHKLKYTMTWDDGTHPNLSTEVDAIYMTFKESDKVLDSAAVIAINSIDNPDQFSIVSAVDGKGKIWIKKTDQEDISADGRSYYVDIVVVLTDGTDWPFVNDYSVAFAQPATQEVNDEI